MVWRFEARPMRTCHSFSARLWTEVMDADVLDMPSSLKEIRKRFRIIAVYSPFAIRSGPPAKPNKNQKVEWLKTTIETGTHYIRIEAMEDGWTVHYVRFEQSKAIAQYLPVRELKKPHTKTPRKRGTKPLACSSRMNFTTAQDDSLETMPGPRPMDQTRRLVPDDSGGPKLQQPTKQQTS